MQQDLFDRFLCALMDAWDRFTDARPALKHHGAFFEEIGNLNAEEMRAKSKRDDFH